MPNNFTIDVGGSPEHEDLATELYYGDDPVEGFVAIIHQENGVDKLEIQIHPRRDGQPWVFDLTEFEEALQRVRQRLYELRREL